MSVYLSDFSILRPEYEISQEFSLEWISSAHALAESRKQGDDFDEKKFQQDLLSVLLRIGAGPGKVKFRGMQHPDFQHMEWERNTLFPDAQNVCFGSRTRYYDEAVEKLFERFYPEGSKLPDDLIHVSCTGYVAPSGAQKLVAKRKAGMTTTVTHAYHMGCYGAISALRMARGFALSGKSKIDIVHTEMCTLHMNPEFHSPEQLVVQTLFADGFCKYTLSSESQKNSLQIVELKEVILDDTVDAMSWQPEHWGLKMGLKPEVPKLIASRLEELVAPLLKTNSPIFAIHPGGPKIIEKVAEVLKLEPWQIAHSKEIFYQCGNMSSASLPHIWDRILQDNDVAKGTSIISLAFGPGLTTAIAVLIKR
jgi:predicted naringenin-chalcone synthase